MKKCFVLVVAAVFVLCTSVVATSPDWWVSNIQGNKITLKNSAGQVKTIQATPPAGAKVGDKVTLNGDKVATWDWGNRTQTGGNATPDWWVTNIQGNRITLKNSAGQVKTIQSTPPAGAKVGDKVTLNGDKVATWDWGNRTQTVANNTVAPDWWLITGIRGSTITLKNSAGQVKTVQATPPAGAKVGGKVKLNGDKVASWDWGN